MNRIDMIKQLFVTEAARGSQNTHWLFKNKYDYIVVDYSELQQYLDQGYKHHCNVHEFYLEQEQSIKEKEKEIKDLKEEIVKCDELKEEIVKKGRPKASS